VFVFLHYDCEVHSKIHADTAMLNRDDDIIWLYCLSVLFTTQVFPWNYFQKVIEKVIKKVIENLITNNVINNCN